MTADLSALADYPPLVVGFLVGLGVGFAVGVVFALAAAVSSWNAHRRTVLALEDTVDRLVDELERRNVERAGDLP